MNFLVQQINGQTVHDFAWELLRCKEYWDMWVLPFPEAGRKEPFVIQYHDTEPGKEILFDGIKDPDSWTPIGSMEFVSAYLRKFYPDSEAMLRPLNVPGALFPFADRPLMNCHNRDDFKKFTEAIPGFWRLTPDIYRKSLDTIKDKFNGPVSYEYDATDFRGCQISPAIDIVSEWRVFVFHNQILDCKNYLGDFFIYPDPERIREMVKAFGNDAPAAYTLDVAVTPQAKTVVIECHRFFSCGLYGFTNLQKYPAMLSQTWFEIKRNIKP